MFRRGKPTLREGNQVKRDRTSLIGTAILATTIAMTACGKTEKATPNTQSGCAMLEPDVCQNLVAVVGENRVGLRYVASGVHWADYTKVLISPVAFYGSAESKVSAKDQQTLTNYLYQELVKSVGAKFPLVETPDQGVMRLQVGITDVEGATPVLRTVSMLVPQARALATLKYAATGTYPFVGGAEAEARVQDSVSGKVLAAAVDRRIGSGSVETVAQWSMGDAQNALDKWADLTADRLVALQKGEIPPGGR
jgi:hypothetical protein